MNVELTVPTIPRQVAHSLWVLVCKIKCLLNKCTTHNMPIGDACLSHIMTLMNSVKNLQTLPTIVKDVADKAALHASEKYDIAIPNAHERKSAASV